MVKFAHLADCHLGGWRQDELRSLNFKSFQRILDLCIQEKVDFILIAGDLFDSAYPPIEILKESFAEFKKIHDAKIPVYLVAGSHDFSASGKTFLDVLERSGFCKNVENWEVLEDGRIKLFPSMHGNIAIYGYPGKKSGMEIDDLRRVHFESVHQYTIFMLHTTIKDVVGTLPIDSLDKATLPLADYYAMGHIHQVFESVERNSRYVYPGPTYPMNFQELADLKYGSFQIINIDNGNVKTKNIKVPLKEVVYLELEIDNGLTATQKIISELDKLSLNDKILLMKLKGNLIQGKTGDIRFQEIEDFIKKKGAFSFLRNLSSLSLEESKFEVGSSSSDNVETIEKEIIDRYKGNDQTEFNKYIFQLMNSLSIEKNEDEKSSIFEERVLSELKNVLNLSEIL